MSNLARSSIVFLLLALIMSGCRKDNENNPVDPGSNTASVLTTIAGVVSDEKGDGMAGISVMAHGRTAITNDHGLFILKDVRVPEDRCFVLVKKDGYFTASRAEKPRSGAVTHMRLSLMSNAPRYSVEASAGGVVKLGEGGAVSFPAHAFATENGQPYTGTVKVAARRLNPDTKTFYDFFPGDFAATRTDGSQTLLYSYGVLRVELTTPSGAKLVLANGQQATLTCPVPSSMKGEAPAEIPLWYFDETIGMWKEEGKVVKQGDVYSGVVSHFTDWNVDIPDQMAFLHGQIQCDAAAIPNMLVQVGQQQVLADKNGMYHCVVPINRSIDISVDPELNFGTGTPAPVAVGPFTDQQVASQDITVTPCPAYITGRLVDCNGQAIGGVVQMLAATGYNYTIAGADGTFRLRVRPDVPLTVVAFDYNGAMSEKLPIQAVNGGEQREVESLIVCHAGQNELTFTDIECPNFYPSITLSSDGTKLAAWSGNELRIYGAQAGTLMHTMILETQSTSAQFQFNDVSFSHDGSMLVASLSDTLDGAEIRIWNTVTGQQLYQYISASALIRQACFLPDDNGLMYVVYPKRSPIFSIRQRLLASGTETTLVTLPEKVSVPVLFGLRQDGTQIVGLTSLSESTTTVKLVAWNKTSGAVAFEKTLSPFQPVWASMSVDGNRFGLLSASRYAFYDMAADRDISSRDIATTLANYGGMVMSPDGNKFAAYYADPQWPLGIYRVDDGALLQPLPAPDGVNQQSPMTSLCYSLNGRHIAARSNLLSGSGMLLRIWHLP